MKINNHKGKYDRIGLETMRQWREEIIHQDQKDPGKVHPWWDVALMLGSISGMDDEDTAFIFADEGVYKRTALYCLLKFLDSPEKRAFGSQQNNAAHALGVLTRNWASERKQLGN